LAPSTQHLREAVLLLLAFQRQNDGAMEPTVLSRIAAIAREIPQKMFDPFKDALINAICAFDRNCDERYNGQRDLIRSHWVKADRVGVSHTSRGLPYRARFARQILSCIFGNCSADCLCDLRSCSGGDKSRKCYSARAV